MDEAENAENVSNKKQRNTKRSNSEDEGIFSGEEQEKKGKRKVSTESTDEIQVKKNKIEEEDTPAIILPGVKNFFADEEEDKDSLSSSDDEDYVSIDYNIYYI